MTATSDELNRLLDQIRIRLSGLAHRFVLIESCTSGMIAAQFGQIPGISELFCGSLVVYRNDSKHRWLDIPTELLDDPNVGPVSGEVTRLLAQSALAMTSEATWALAITGHLGPMAPPELDGVVFVSVARHKYESSTKVKAETIESTAQAQLVSPPPVDSNDWKGRAQRQIEATQIALEFFLNQIQSDT